MFRSLKVCLPFLSLAAAAALPSDINSLEERANPLNPPRNQVYVQTFRNATGGQFSMLPMIQNPTQLTHVYLAALHINADPNAITLNDNSPNDTMYTNVWSEVSQLQSSGVKVMQMLGGAAQGSYVRLCSGPTNTVINETYYQPLYWFLKSHNLDGVNLDIEEKVAYTCPLALLRRFNKDFGTGFILTMAPVASELQPSGYGLGGFSYKTLDAQATNSSKPNGKLVNWYNAQFYNGWGDASKTSGYDSIIRNGYTASRVAIGVLDNSSDGGSGWFKISTYQATIKALRAKYGASFGGVAAWEYFNGGQNDSLAYPYQWVQGIGQSTVNKRDTRDTAPDGGDPSSYGPAPWPLKTDRLAAKGRPHIAAVRALNISRGNEAQAAQILGVTLS